MFKIKALPFVILCVVSFFQNINAMEEKTKELEKIEKKYNLHRVDNRIIRSGLISNPEDLQKFIDFHKIKKIFTFTNKDKEIVQKVVQTNNIPWKFLVLPSSDIPKIKDFSKLIEVINNINDVNLFHDKDGANRTGFFAALYLILILKKAGELSNEDLLNKAKDQLSMKYGYMTWYHQLVSKGGINFITYFGECYLKLLDLIKKDSLDAKKLSDKDKQNLKEKLNEKYLDYVDYAFEAIKLFKLHSK